MGGLSVRRWLACAEEGRLAWRKGGLPVSRKGGLPVRRKGGLPVWRTGFVRRPARDPSFAVVQVTPGQCCWGLLCCAVLSRSVVLCCAV